MAIIIKPEDIIVEFLRARLTDPRGRHTADSDSFTATSGQTEFTLTPTAAGSLVRAITGVTVASTGKKKWQEYSIDLKAPKVTLETGATTGQTVVVNYLASASGSEWIYPGMPIATMAKSNFPRISVQLVNMTSDRAGPVTAPLIDSVHFQIDVWTKEGYTKTISSEFYTEQKLADYLGERVKEAFGDNIDDLYPKLYDYSGAAFGQMPFEEATHTFRHKQEITLTGLNVSH